MSLICGGGWGWFSRPNPFASSIRDNVAYGPRLHGTTDRGILDGIVEAELAGYCFVG